MTSNQKKPTGYERIYLDLASRLAAFDLVGNAPHLGLEISGPDAVSADFFGRKYLIDRQGVKPIDGRPAGINSLSLIAHYAMSSGRGEPDYEFVPLTRLTGLVEGRNSFDKSIVSRVLSKKFKTGQQLLDQAAAAIGGQYQGLDSTGGLAWIFKAFPKVALKLVYHPEDEEFPAEFRLLFDAKALDFMEFEALGFLCGVFAEKVCWAADEFECRDLDY